MVATRGRPRRDRWIAGLVLLLCAASPGAAAAGMLSLPPLRDNTLFEDANGDTSSGAGPAVFAGENSQGRIRRAVLKFDVGLPDGFVADSARLRLHVSNVSDPLPRVMTLHRLNASWGSGVSSAAGGAGGPATPGDATWIHRFYPDTPWLTPGGDFEPTPSAAITVSGIGDYEWSGPWLAADVLYWLEHPEANFGWILIGDESAPNTARRFDSLESATEADRPALVVFTTEVPTLITSWGRIKARYR